MYFYIDLWISSPTGGRTAEGLGQGGGREETVPGSRDVAAAFAKEIGALLLLRHPVTTCTSCGERAEKDDVK